MKKLIAFFAGLALAIAFGVGAANFYNLYTNGTVTGPVKANGTGQGTAATSTDITALWTGTCNSTTFLRADGSCQTAGGGSGTVTSVAISTPNWLTVSGSPITTSGTLTLGGVPASDSTQSIGVGVGALTQGGITGVQNTAVGNGALGATTSGSDNTAVGSASGNSLTTGIDNTFLGRRAGINVTTGNSNLILTAGDTSGLISTGGSSNIIIGNTTAGLTATSSNQLSIASLIFLTTISTSAPAVSACGTSPSIDANANNHIGTVTVGTVSAASCTVTFSGGYNSFVHCQVTSQTAIATFAYSYNTSAITVTATSLVGDKFDYACEGL